MTAHDPIASYTLAALYVRQGHRNHALEVLDEVLDRDPFDGHALCLRQRLTRHAHATLACTIAAGTIEIAWSAAPIAPRLVVIATVFRPWKSSVRTIVQSTHANTASGHWILPRPCPRGSITACMGRVELDSKFVPRVVSAPTSWDMPHPEPVRSGAVPP